MTKNYTLKQQATYVFIGKVSALLATCALPIILVRLFTQEQFGLYRQAIMVGLTFVHVLEFSIFNSLFYFYSIAKTKEELSLFISQTFYVLSLIGIIIFSILILFKNPILSLLNINSFSDIYFCIALYILLSLIAYGLQDIFVNEGKANWAMIYEFVNQLFRVAFLLTAVIIFKSVTAALWSLIAHAGMKALFLFIYLRYAYQISIFKIKKTNIAQQFKYIFPYMAA